MRIPNQVLFLGKRRWPEFDCSEAPLPDRFILQLMDARWRRATLSPSETMVGWLAQDSLGATEEDPHSRRRAFWISLIAANRRAVKTLIAFPRRPPRARLRLPRNRLRIAPTPWRPISVEADLYLR
jgi:hypothetical protein